MSLQDIRSECSDTAGLLQPYVDGELASAEQERVAEHLEDCRPCRHAVSEQQWVRSTLRAVKRDQAPTSLRARILAELDAVEREAAAAAPPRPSLWTRATSALADAGRGAMIMVPAGAVAVGLFFVAREGLAPAQTMPGGLGSALTQIHDEPAPPAVAAAPTPARPGASLPPMAGSDPGDLQLVRADLPSAPGPQQLGARLRYEIVRGGLPTGQHVIDLQAPGGAPPTGRPMEYGGRRFHLDETVGGEPGVRFELAGVSHMFVLEGGETSDDFAVLLELIDRKFDQKLEDRHGDHHGHQRNPQPTDAQ